MKKISLQVTLSIITSALLVLLIIVIVFTVNNRRILTIEFEEKVFYYTETYAYRFSEKFGTQQQTVNNMKSFIGNMILSSDHKDNSGEFKKKHRELDKIIKKLALKNKDLSSTYFTFDTKVADGEDEIWYARVDDKVFKADYSEFGNMWEEVNEVNESSYYNAIECGAVWGDVYYEPVLDAEVVSYVVSVYDTEDKFLGVAGVDVKVSDILSDVENIKIHGSGNAFLVDSNLEYITGSISEAEYNDIKKKDVFKSEFEGPNNSGIIRHKIFEKKYVLAHAQLSNGWILMINQPEAEVLAPITTIQYIVIVFAFIVLLISILSAMYFTKKQIQPIVHEYEEKDIFIHAQARSAKLGEMLSNIAHQWKQPLNSITINISNLSDDYHGDSLDPVHFDDYIERLKKTISNMSETVEDFANFLKPDKSKDVFEINKEIKNVLTIIGPMINKQSIRIIQTGDIINGYGYKNEYAQVIFNIINNAVDAVSEASSKEKIIKIHTEIINKVSYVKIYNNGEKISEENMKKLFVPYFSTKAETHGTGLGLYMSKEIIEENMGGKIIIYNVDDGVECVISIPGEGKNDISI